jgi:hypothetical protein
MSSVAIIAGIIILLVALVCYAFAMQTIQHKREKRKRLLAALGSQARSFKFILTGCPEGFLTKDLKIIVLRSLVEVHEQLAQLEPGNTAHKQDIQQYSAAMADAQRTPPSDANISLASQQQIKEAKMSLEELHKFIFRLESNNRVSRNQADSYRSQIKQLVLKITVDGYILNGKAANQSGKTKLALHNFDLALKLLIRESKAGRFEALIAQLKGTCAELTEKLLAEEDDGLLPMSDEEREEQDALNDEWDKFSDDGSEGLWKKKQVYD